MKNIQYVCICIYKYVKVCSKNFSEQCKIKFIILIIDYIKYELLSIRFTIVMMYFSKLIVDLKISI